MVLTIMTCKSPFCNNQMMPRVLGVNRHHNFCEKHFWYNRNVSRNYVHDKHRYIAFGDVDGKLVHCNVCGDSVIKYFNKHCTKFFTKAKLYKLSYDQKLAIGHKLFQVDHINGRFGSSKKYNHPSNLQFICSNCHDAKTIINGESKKTKYMPV